MVVTSNGNYPYVPFLPDDAKTTRCIYVAFHYYGAGHYDATTALKGQCTPCFDFLRLALAIYWLVMVSSQERVVVDHRTAT